MTQSTDITLTAGDWTQLTNADAAGDVTFQNKTGDRIWIKPTTDTTKPTDFTGALAYEPWQGESLKTLVELFPGLSGADRFWAWSHNGGKVMVSHA